MSDALSERVQKWSRIMREEATGPLRIAPEVVEVIDGWAKYRKQAGEIAVGAWLKHVFGHSGRNVRYWRDRAEAVTALDKRRDRSVERTLHHLAAVWLAKQPEKYRNVTMSELFLLSKEQKGEPITKAQAARVYRSVAGVKAVRPSRRPCDECERLRALLAAHGIEDKTAA